MNPNEIFISAASALVVFILITIYKNSKNETVDRSETCKISVVVGLLIFGILAVYTKPLEPILNEPFTSAD